MIINFDGILIRDTPCLSEAKSKKSKYLIEVRN